MALLFGGGAAASAYVIVTRRSDGAVIERLSAVRQAHVGESLLQSVQANVRALSLTEFQRYWHLSDRCARERGWIAEQPVPTGPALGSGHGGRSGQVLMNCSYDHVKTPRLVLRRVVEHDLVHVVAVEADPATNAFRPGGAPSASECQKDLDAYLQVRRDHGVGYWVVERDGEVVGLAGVRPMTLAGRGCWNLYYRFKPAAWGRGYATEAAAAALGAAKALAADRPVVARTGPENLPSRRVAERLGLLRNPALDDEGYVVFTTGW